MAEESDIETEEADEPDELEASDSVDTEQVSLSISESEVLLPTTRTTLASLLASLLLHALVVVPIFIPGLIRSDDADFDVEWMTQFEDLRGLGMSSGRWAEVKPMPPPEEPADETEAEPPKKPEKEPEPEKKPERKKPEPTKPSEAEAVPADAPKKKELEPPPEEERPENPYARGDRLPGVDRSGPSGLPDMEAYGPGNVVYSALVRTDRIRGTAFEEATRRILENVPDYRIALQGTGIDPVEDVDSIFMASARPRYIQHTFVAVRHSLEPDELKSRLERRFVDNAPWYDYKGYTARAIVPEHSGFRDPRQIVLARPGLAVIARPEWLPEITGEVAPDDPLAAGLELEEDESRPTMLDGLTQIERAIGGDDTLVAVSGRGVRLLLPGLGRIQFEAAKLVIADASAPRLTIDMTFDSPQTARRFASGCPKMKDDIIAQVPFLGRGLARTVLDPLRCRQTEQYVTIQGNYTAKEVERLMNFAVPFIPRPPSLQKLPVSPPPPRPAKAPDAGVGPDAGGAEPAGSEAGGSDAGTEPGTDADAR